MLPASFPPGIQDARSENVIGQNANRGWSCYSDLSFCQCPGSEKDITEVSGTSSPGSIPGRGTN